MPGGHINPAVTFRLFLARKLSLPRAVFYMICQCLGAICGAGVVKGFMEGEYKLNGGGANSVAHGYTKGDGFGAEILLAPLPIGFAVFLVHLATIPITRTSINPARSLGAAIVYNKSHAWNDQVWERELKTIEECKLGVSAAKRRQQMIGCLPKLFNMIRDIFRLSKCSVLTSQELVHKIISNDTDVIDRSEVEERLHLLRQLAPEWIS